MLQKLHLIFMIFMNSYDSIISTVFVRIYDHVGDSSNETLEKHFKYAAIYLLYVKIEKIYLYFFLPLSSNQQHSWEQHLLALKPLTRKEKCRQS